VTTFTPTGFKHGTTEVTFQSARACERFTSEGGRQVGVTNVKALGQCTDPAVRSAAAHLFADRGPAWIGLVTVTDGRHTDRCSKECAHWHPVTFAVGVVHIKTHAKFTEYEFVDQGGVE
jgi:hypothetical protein